MKMDIRTINDLEITDPSAETRNLITKWRDMVKPGFFRQSEGRWKKYHKPKLFEETDNRSTVATSLKKSRTQR